MKKIADYDWQKLTKAVETFSETSEEIEAARTEFDEKLAALSQKANEQREIVYGVLSEYADDAEQYYDERSEKWRDSDAGQSFYDWKEEVSFAKDSFDMDVNFHILEVNSTAELEAMIYALDCNIRQSVDD
jgi:hypothetical protein